MSLVLAILVNSLAINMCLWCISMIADNTILIAVVESKLYLRTYECEHNSQT